MGADGEMVTKPWPLVRAELVDSLCRRWGCLPSQLYQESAYEVFQTLTILGLVGQNNGGRDEAPKESDMGFNMRTLGDG